MKINKQTLLLFLLLSATFVSMAQKKTCIEVANEYYAVLNDYARYPDMGNGYVYTLFYMPEKPENNIVHIDLRLFQGMSISKNSVNIKDYLDAIKALRNEGKGIKYEWQVDEKSYTETTTYLPELQRKGVKSSLRVDKTITCGSESKRLVDVITFFDGGIAKVETEVYVKPDPMLPIKNFLANAFEPWDELVILGLMFSPQTISFGAMLAKTTEHGIGYGVGCDVNGLAALDSEKKYYMPTLYFPLSYNTQYWSAGVLGGIGYYGGKERSETIDGVTMVVQESHHSAHVLLCPYITIRFPDLGIDIPGLDILLGYNFYFVNGSQFNGMRFGINFLID